MSKNNASDHLRAELQQLSDSLEELLDESVDESDKETLRDKARAALEGARLRLSETGERLTQNTREAACRADDYVREKPWHGVGAGAVLGLVLGLLLARR